MSVYNQLNPFKILRFTKTPFPNTFPDKEHVQQQFIKHTFIKIRYMYSVKNMHFLVELKPKSNTVIP